MAPVGVGPLVKRWRGHRRLSQLDLANVAGVSPKHLSFVETGRSRPSPELLLTLARHLEVPLRERNDLLLAAGYAPRFDETELGSPTMAPVRDTLAVLLDRHDPYPGVLLDRCWNVVMANKAASLLAGLIPAELAGPPINLFRASLHPDGLAAHTRNFDDWALYLLDQLRRLVNVTADPALAELEREVLAYPTVVGSIADRRGRTDAPSALVLSCELTVEGRDLSLLTTLTTFGSPLDITLDELMIELFYPTDDATASALAELTGL
ncbi:MAG: helix-turn-helix transcriptional regulator [Acidimicrobiia bacterium]|nr:helix-turn-helix transcriptional regulator [Acidimicrobiia bacterium]